MGAGGTRWGWVGRAACWTLCSGATETIFRSARAQPAQACERQPIGRGLRAPCYSRGFWRYVSPCCCPRQPASTSHAVYALASGVQSSSGSALSRAHHGRLTPWDMELHRCTRNDGSMQPRWYDDRLAVPTGAMPRLLVHLWAGGALDFMGMVSLHDHLVELRRAAGQAGAQVVARHSWAGAAPRPLQLGLERTLTRLLPPPPGAAVGVHQGAPSSSA
jgi:hypothetical protein